MCNAAASPPPSRALRSDTNAAAARQEGMRVMTQQDREQKLDEVDRLLNDPDVALEPSRVWSLLEELARLDVAPIRAAA